MKKGRKKNPKFARPKGRALDPTAVAHVHALLADEVPQRDRLIEYLHRLQDHDKHLPLEHLHALADWLKLSPVEVYEVATFYHHFDVVHDDETPPAPRTLRVCDSIACMLAGSEALLAELDDLPPGKVRIQRVPCVGRCEHAPVAVLDQCPIDHASPPRIDEALVTPPKLPEPDTHFEAYLSNGGYQIFQQCLAGKLNPDTIIETLEQAQLRGLGGAGFPAGRKWRILREQPAPRWIAVNVDEGEPGTFKDRITLETAPHALLEGLLIAAQVIDSQQCVIYVRDEYPMILRTLQLALTELSTWLGEQQPGYTLPHIELRRGAGAYICGEESAMLESIEGKRGLPRHRPPYIAENGLFGQPTLEHNAETLLWVPELLRSGADAFLQHGRRERHGLRRLSLSGRIKQPGVYLAPAGISVRELIDEYGGGMLDDHTFYGYLPGGASGGILPARLGDLPLDFDTLQEHGCFIGSAAVMVFSEQDKARDIALNAMRFFAHESCGQCTPCREGTHQAAQMMQQATWPADTLESLAQTMEDASICGLGQAAPNPVRCVLKYFPQEVS